MKSRADRPVQQTIFNALTERLRKYFAHLLNYPGADEQVNRAEQLLALAHRKVEAQLAQIEALRREGHDTSGAEQLLDKFKKTEEVQQKAVDALKIEKKRAG